jgi:hypothetical protein
LNQYTPLTRSWKNIKYKEKNEKLISITYEPEKLVQKFLNDHQMKSDVGLDEDFRIFRSYNAWAIKIKPNKIWFFRIEKKPDRKSKIYRYLFLFRLFIFLSL